MKPARWIGCAAAAAILIAGASADARAQRGEPVPADLEGVDVIEHPDAALPLELVFQDERGEPVALGQYFHKDRPVLLVLGYYECPMLCTLVLNGLVDALNDIDWVPGEQFEIVTLSIDPGETPKLAAWKKQNYLEAYGRPAAAAGWHFLTGRETQIRQLADALGFGYRYVEQRDEYAHPAVLFIATPEGRIARYLYGVSYEPRTLRLSLVEASRGKIGTTLDRVLLYCYHYDSTAGRYAPVAVNIMRAGGAISVALLGGFLAWLWVRDVRRRRTA